MANSKIYLKSEAGGTTTLSRDTTANSGNLVLPASGNIASVDTAVTDNAIARYDSTTGKLQNSGVIIDDNGNVGIGVTPSASTVSTLQSQYNMSTGNDESNLSTNAYYSGGVFKYIANGYATSYIQQKAGGSHTWKTAPSGTAGNAITWTNAMTLDINDNIVIGNNNKNTHVIAKYNASNQTYIRASAVADTSVVFASDVAGVLKAAIYANGNFGSANQVYSGVSDAKLKENVVDATPKLEKLMQVQVRNFNFIGQEDKQIGVIAQEIEQVFPSLIFETKDTKQVEVTKTRDVTDEDGNVTQEEYTETETQETGEVTKNVKYSIIYMMMLKGLQEMRAEYTAEINDLKARIEILEGAK